jgi:hypothetical protein
VAPAAPLAADVDWDLAGYVCPPSDLVDGNNYQIEAITTLAADCQVKVLLLIDLIRVRRFLWKAASSPRQHV